MEQLVHQIERFEPGQLMGFIGSSLGGYYSLYLKNRFEVPAVLINPAIRPYELLTDYLGENTNLYTGETYEVRPEHMDELRAFDRVGKTRLDDILLLTQTGDEVLDFSLAVNELRGAQMWIQYGGDHAFQDCSSALPAIRSFFKLAPSAA